MQALESLERDHWLLRGLTEALEVYVAALEAGQPLRAGDLRDLVNGLRVVADYRHLEKVEEVLVPAMVRGGVEYDLDTLDEERREHERVRYLIEVLHQAAEREPSWSLDERQRIARAARHLVGYYRELVTQLEQELFPKILSRLEPLKLGQLTQQLCQFDAKRDARDPMLDIPALSQSVLARYASRPEATFVFSQSRDLPSVRELAR